MSDQHPEDTTPGVDAQSQELAPAPPAKAPLHAPAKRALTAMAGVLVVAAVGFGIVSLSEGDGAASAEDAVQELFAAVDRQDAIGVAESLEPTERRILVDALEQTAAEARRVEVANDSLNLRNVSGVDLTVENLQLDATALDDDTYAVDITAGQISSRTELSKLPIGSVVQEVIDRNEESGETVTDASSDVIDLAGVRIVAVTRGGGWYVSALFSLAEQIRLDGDPVAAYPAASSAIPAVGADTPEAAVREGIAAAVDADVRRLIELTPADEARVLHTYGPILVDGAQGEETGVTIDNLELTVSDAAGGRKRVSATSMTMTVTTDWDRQVTTYDGDCSTTTWEVTDPDAYGPTESESDNEWTQCSDDTSLSPFGLFNVIYAPGNLDMIVEEHDGKWFLSPAGTLIQNTVGTLKGLNTDAIRRTVRSWAGEWWLYESPEFWSACGVAEPSLDDTPAQAEAAYESCTDSLPEDYTGRLSPFSGSYTDGALESIEVSGDGCHGSGNEVRSNAAIEQCMADLVAAGTIPPEDLELFRCQQIFDALPYSDDASDAENEALWDEADAQYQACVAALGTDGSTPGEVPATTTPPSNAETPTILPGG